MSELVAAEPNSTNPLEVVEFAQQMRYRMIDDLTNNGQNLTGNFKETSQLLRDMVQTAQVTQKLDIEAKAVDNTTNVLAIHRQLSGMLGHRDPFEAREDAPIPVAQRVQPPLPDKLPAFDVKSVPGEYAQNEQTLAISSFVDVEE